MTKIALVTGAGSGIGQHTTGALAAAGYHVVACGRRESALNDTVKLFARHSTISGVPCDVSSENSVNALFQEIETRFGRLDLVFNNAGTNAPALPIDELSVAQWRQVIDVNVHGAFLIARAAFGLMRRQQPQGGRIINNGSISAYVPRPGTVAYTVSKHAITGLTRTLSLDGRAYDIACGQIDIGNAASDMTAKMNSGVPQADGSIKPEPTMDTKHIADAVVNMASLPLNANIQFMTIMATKMPYIGRG